MYYTKKRILNLQNLRKISALLMFAFVVQVASSQVTIGADVAPHEDAILDLKQNGTTTGGLLLPRVALESIKLPNPMTEHVAGMTVYNTSSTPDMSPGMYYNDGVKWSRLFTAEDSFFYMPAIVLPLDETDPAFSGGRFIVNLYTRYKEQFGLPVGSTVVSETTGKLPVYENDQLYYFVTYYDNNVFTDVALTADGELSYKLKPSYEQSEKTYMNIVLKIK